MSWLIPRRLRACTILTRGVTAISRSRFVLAAAIAGCGATPREVPQHAATAPAPPPDAEVHHLAELETPPPQKLLAIDWSAVSVATDADADALWKQIAPTGSDWEQKLDELPGDSPIPRALAISLLHGGNFTCLPTVPPLPCSHPQIDVDPPAQNTTLADPCLRRMLAVWAIAQLEPEDVPKVRDALRAIAQIPPPESQLVASAIRAIPEDDQDGRMAMLTAAWQAGQHELVNGMLGDFDQAHLITAAQNLHFDGALEVLSAESNRAVYLRAVDDEKLATKARLSAITDLEATGTDDKIPADLHAALATATRSPDCAVAAGAAHVLDAHGEHRFAPTRPHARTAAPVMRALCVLASFEQLQKANEASPLATFVPARGLELVKIVHDEYNEVDNDGDGDPHTERTIDLLPRDSISLVDVEEIARAIRNCAGTICRSEDHEFRFDLTAGAGGELVLSRLEVIDRPPCK